MPLLTRAILTAAPLGDRVAFTLVELAPRTARTLASENLDAPESASPELLAAAASRVANGRQVDEVVVVAPSDWCATREIGIAPADWPSARAGVLESLEDLVPVPAEQALVGLLGLSDHEENCSRGGLIAARREPVERLLAVLRSAATGATETVLSSTMAALGLGLEGRPDAMVIEPGGAVALAAALFHPEASTGDHVIAVASGGNVDPAIFHNALTLLEAA